MKEQKIVVLDRGFVYVGEVEFIDRDMIRIENAKNIRRWGTTKGLGELSLKGPTPNTVLDEVGTILAPVKSLIHLIECKKTF